jgi:DNA-binding CsgD family transcriptional regulator/PAS domain-containing protein
MRELLDLLYATVGDPDGWAPFMAALVDGSSFNRVALTFHDTAVPAGSIDAQIGFDPTDIARYVGHYAALNPWLASPAQRPIGVVTSTDTIMSRADLLKTEWYADYCRALGVDLAVGLTIQQDASRSLVLSALGLRENLPRDRVIRRNLRGVAPHLLRVAQLNRQFAAVSTQAMAAEQALDQLATAMLIVNPAGQVAYLNAVAGRIIAAGDGPLIVQGMLDAAQPREGAALRHLVAQALLARQDEAATPGGVMRISRTTGRMAYELLVAPMPASNLALGLTGPLAVVFLRDPHAREPAPLDRLRRLYGLTAAEARLMRGLLAGDTLESLTKQFGVTRETLRSQLKSVFLKTGTSSQIELIRLGLRGLPAFGS